MGCFWEVILFKPYKLLLFDRKACLSNEKVEVDLGLNYKRATVGYLH